VAPLFVPRVDAQPLKPLCEVCKELAKSPAEKIPFTTTMWSGLNDFGHNTKDLFTTPQGWLTIGGWGFYYGSCLAAVYVALHMPDHFIHPDTLRWYCHTYAPYESTTQLMKETIVTLQDQSLDAAAMRNNKQTLTDSLDRLVRYGESICAYMAYKTKQLDEYESPVAERAARGLFKFYNAWLMTISAQCNRDNPDYDEINRLITAYEMVMATQLKHFYAIEGETEAEKRAMKRRE
jgi:hypothetical protein